MSYIQLYELLPDVASRETRTITAFEQRLKRHYKLFRAKIDEHYENKQV